jgi:hypothetical protein
MATNITANSPGCDSFQSMERFKAESNVQKDTDSGTPSDPLPPLGVLLLATEASNASPVTLLPIVEAAAESPLVNAFKAPYDTTDDGVHLSIPVAPAPIVRHAFNLIYENGEDSDGEIGPYYDAVVGEDMMLLSNAALREELKKETKALMATNQSWCKDFLPE